MPLCEQASGWWLWKKPKACSPDDESWDNMQSISFSGPDLSQDGSFGMNTHGTSGSFDTGSAADGGSSSDSGGSD